MWKKFSCFIALFISIFAVALSTVKAGNEITNEPYDTWIVGLDGKMVVSSMAYEGINVMNIGFNSPQDIFIDEDDFVYVADSKNKVVYKFTNTKNVVEIGEGILSEPYGVTVAKNGNVYVADKAGYVYVFALNTTTNEYDFVSKYGKPKEPLFGEGSAFNPIKIAVDDSYNLYVISEANSNGVIQLNQDGSFAGYFGPHNTAVSFNSIFNQLLNGEDVTLASGQLPTTNLAVDKKNIVYTLVDGASNNSLKKFNVNGTNILKSETNLNFSSTFRDVAIDNDGLIYTVCNDNTGVISVRDTTGAVLFTFGNKSLSTTSNTLYSIGYFSSPVGIDVDSNGNIWVLDNVDKSIQVFTRTKFAATVINAMNLYNEGMYEEAEIAYQEVVTQNSSFTQAYIGLGNIAQREQRFEEARDYFKIANYKAGYSNAFWEIRDGWISDNILWVFAAIALVCLFNFFNVKFSIYAKIGFDPEKAKAKINKNSYVKEFKYLKRMIAHPADTVYDIKFLQKIRFSTGLIFFALFVIINIACDTAITGYIFRTQLDSEVNIMFELLKWGLVVLLIIIGNFLVSSLQKGEGFFRDIFIGVMVAFAPLLLFKLPLSIISNVLTFNEAYIFDLINLVLWAWSIFNVIYVIKAVHNYTIGELIVNLILTAVAVIILVFLFLMVYILFMQFYQFVAGLVEEAILR